MTNQRTLKIVKKLSINLQKNAKNSIKKRIFILFKVNWIKIKYKLITSQRTLKIVKKTVNKSSKNAKNSI